MARANESVATLLQEYADLLSITGGSNTGGSNTGGSNTGDGAYKARVYEKAARAIAGHHEDVSTLDATAMRRIPNVGTSIAQKIAEYLEHGHIEAVEKLRMRIPAGVRALTTVPGLGPKKAMALYEELGISSIDELAEAIDEGRLSGMRGFGAKTAANLLHGIELARADSGRSMVDVAAAVAEEIVGAVSAVPGCQKCVYAGSLRRMRETVGDIDILASATDPAPLMAALTAAMKEALVRLDLVSDVIVAGEKKTSVRTSAGLQVDLRVVPAEAWGAALLYFTGSKEHNVRIREIAVRKGLKLSEYGLFRVDDGRVIVSETEEEVYSSLGLPWIAPTLREDRGEVDAALAGRLPRLLVQADIRGDLHTHTSLTDGVSTLEEMVAAARARGLSYYAVTDHAENMPMQRMTRAKMLAQRERLRSVDAGRTTLLHGTELNLDPDGGVDWDPEFLAGFDICVASVHSHFTQTPAELTRRFVRACENPYVAIVGHPTTRSIGRRAPIDADWDAVFAAAARTGTAMEINCFPDRLDLPDELILRAKRYGVRFAINTDAHSVRHLDNLRYGVGMAQRGWLTTDDVINAWPLPRLRAFVRAKRRTA